MRSLRSLSVATAVVAAAALAAGAALAAPGHRSGARSGGFGTGFGPFAMPGRGPGFGPFARPGRGPGFGGPGGLGLPGLGMRMPGGAAGLFGIDVLTPAAAYLDVPLSTLQSDLKSGKTLADEAKAKNKDVSGLVDAIVAAEKKVLDGYVAAGWLTSDQETNVLSGLKKGIESLVNVGPPVPRAKPQQGLLQTAASYLGIGASDLRSDLRSGKSLADEASAHGKTVDGLVQALLAPAKSRLDKAVSAGKITQAQESSLLDGLTKRLTDLANRKFNASTAGAVQQAVLKLALRF